MSRIEDRSRYWRGLEMVAAATLGEVVSVRAVTVIGNRYGCCNRDGGMSRSSSIVIHLPRLKVRCPTRMSASVNAIKRRGRRWEYFRYWVRCSQAELIDEGELGWAKDIFWLRTSRITV